MTRFTTRSERVWDYYDSACDSKTKKKKTQIKYFNKIIDEIKAAKKTFNYFGFLPEEEKQIKAHLK